MNISVPCSLSIRRGWVQHCYMQTQDEFFFGEWNSMAEVKLDAMKIARTRLYHLYEYRISRHIRRTFFPEKVT